MIEAKLNRINPGHWQLEGSLTLASVADLAAAGKRLAAGGKVIELDLAGIHQGSSAAVALLLEWKEQICRAGGQLQLRNCPEALRRIAEFSNVDGLLGLA
jgi:phospholipid transport system transporter-binding protein